MPLFKGFFVSLQSIRGQYASIISTIVDRCFWSLKVERLVCFNNFYYCRSPSVYRTRSRGLVCFNNFYYCRSKILPCSGLRLVCFNNFYYCRSLGLYLEDFGLVCFNNFYYCRLHNHPSGNTQGQYASIISTIVDRVTSRICNAGLVCFNNFYYCRWN